MSWTILIGLAVVLGLMTAVVFLRRAELGRMSRSVEERNEMARHGNLEVRLQHPVIDLSRCMGCATCVAVCPEDGVLAIVHGQASVVNGAACVGVSACARECPVDAIAVTLANAKTRRDIPAVDDQLEAIGTPGLFLAGEVTAQSLIKTAIEHGTRVAAEVARRKSANGAARESAGVLDLLIVGAGPAGLACALESKKRGVRALVVDQESTWGGTVAKYPRRKLVLSQPVDLPLHGRLKQTSYSKEELMQLWLGIAAENELPFVGGHALESLQRDENGLFLVMCGGEMFCARHVCLALGRRGTPRRLGVVGEELPKVTHSLFDASAYRGRRVLVVGGGDSAVEAALALATQPGNVVSLSYRKRTFHRLKSRNRDLLQQRVANGGVQVLIESEVSAIHADQVDLVIRSDGEARTASLPNDDIFVMIGGVAPFALLESAGVSFDPTLRPAAVEHGERGSGLKRALWIALGFALVVASFALWHADYYFLPRYERPTHPKHEWLRPGQGLGLAFGLSASALIGVNLLYLLRRARLYKLTFGALSSWMTVHVGTGIIAVLLAFLHAAMEPRNTVGGHSLWILAALLGTGAIGRYLYAWVPRAANGQELAIDEIRTTAHALPQSWEGAQRRFGETALAQVMALIRKRQWQTSFVGRAWALFGDQRDLRRALGALERAGLRTNIPAPQVAETLDLVRAAHRQALIAAHYEDLRSLASSWRYLHRWGAVLMVILVAMHVAHALMYGDYFSGGGA